MKLLLVASLAFCNAEMGRQRRWRMERRKKAAAAAAAARREREKKAPRDAESTSDGTISNWRERARAFGLNPPDEDNSTKPAANATAAAPGAGAKDELGFARAYRCIDQILAARLRRCRIVASTPSTRTRHTD